MSSAECLREFVSERLTAAAEEIFRVFKQTIVEYEEEIDRQRRLLDVVWKPGIQLQRIEPPQQYVFEEEGVLTDQQLCIQERNSSLDQEDPEPPQIKEEQEELCISQEGEQLLLKQETDAFMLTPTDEESEPEPRSDHQLLSHNSYVAERRDQEGGERGGPGSSRDAVLEPKKRHHSNNVYNSNMSEIHCNTHTDEKSFRCDFCGKYFKRNSTLNIHLRIHTGEKPYACKTCRKAFRTGDHLKVHIRRSHTGEKPYSCKTCGRAFASSSELTAHMRTHTGEKPYICKTCGKRYRDISALKKHVRIHPGEKPYTCKTCGRAFRFGSSLTAHMKTHNGEKPHTCKTCGKAFGQSGKLRSHMRRGHTAAVKRRTSRAREHDIDPAAGEHLKHAPGRAGGRRHKRRL